MIKSRKLAAACVRLSFLLLPLLFSHSTAAAIFEGRFYGKMWEWYHTNLDETPEAFFWASENAYTDFIGTAWYDIGVAQRAARKSQQEPAIELRDWPHPSITLNSGALQPSTPGNFPAVTFHPTQKLDLEQYESRFESYENVNASYHGGKNPVTYHSNGPTAYDSFLEGVDLLQDSSLNPFADNNGALSFISKEDDDSKPNETGNLPPLLEEVINIDIRAKVVEPSSLLLLLGSLPLIYFRGKARSET